MASKDDDKNQEPAYVKNRAVIARAAEARDKAFRAMERQGRKEGRG